MKQTKWTVARLGTGEFTVFRREGGEITYSGTPRTLFDSADGAQQWADNLNNKPRTPPTCTAGQFAAMIEPITLRPKTAAALRAILVDGRTWLAASRAHHVTESGILRAMRRLAASIHA